MRCTKCRKPISSIERKNAVVVHAKGTKRVLGIYHRKCYYVMKRETNAGHGALDDGRYLKDAPDAYDMTTLNRRQEEIEEQASLEPRPEGWADYHDTAEVDL